MLAPVRTIEEPSATEAAFLSIFLPFRHYIFVTEHCCLNLSTNHEITFYNVIFEYFQSRQTDKFQKNSCKIEKNVYNINECIFRAGCDSLPVVKVHDPTQYSRLIW